jgi:hypothetical protein
MGNAVLNYFLSLFTKLFLVFIIHLKGGGRLIFLAEDMTMYYYDNMLRSIYIISTIAFAKTNNYFPTACCDHQQLKLFFTILQTI